MLAHVPAASKSRRAKTGEITYKGHVGDAVFTAPAGHGLRRYVDRIELVSAVGLGGGGGGGTDDQTAAEVSVDATSFSGNLTSADSDVQTALDTIDEFTLGGGGGTGTAERTSIYLDAADRAQATFLSASFDEAIVDGYDLEFVLFNGGATGVRRAYARMSSDEFLLLAAQAAAPTDVSEAQGLLVRQADLSGTSTSPANVLDLLNVWQGATASDFYYRTGRSGTFRLQVYKYVQGGAAGATGPAGVDGTATLDAVDRSRLNSVDGLVAKTADLSINSGTPDWNNVTDLANGGFVAHNEIPTSAQAQALTYVLTTTGTAADAAKPYTLIKIIDTYDERDIRIRQHLSPDSYFITNWHHIADHGGFSYFYSHHNLFQGYEIHIQHNDEIAGTDTSYRGDVGDAVFTAPDGTGNLADTVDTVAELVTAVDDLTLGGGGGGTDDQTAAEVSVDATGFTGNLATTDDDVQTALDTIDGLALGSGGTVTTEAPVSGDGSAVDPVT